MYLNRFVEDPTGLAWQAAIVFVFAILVVLPAIRIVLAAGLYGVALLRHDDAMRHSARRMLPGFAQAVLGVVVGVGAIAVPAAQATAAATGISVDRVAATMEASGVAPGSSPTEHAEPETSHSNPISLDRTAAAQPAPPGEPAVTTVSAGPASYTVQRGDSLWSIAEAQGTATDAETAAKWREIWNDNRAVIGEHPGIIRPGLVLTLEQA